MTDRREEKKNLRALSVGGLLILLVSGIFIFRAFWNRSPEEKAETKPTLSETKEEEKIPTITAEVIQQKILNNEQVVFLDVRDKENFDSEHIPHSILTSPSTLSAYTAGKGTLVVVVLSNRDKEREAAVNTILKQKSYPAFILKGGIEEWKRGGNPILGTGDPNSLVDQSKVTYISPDEALKNLKENGANTLILDVQSEQNFREKHWKGAVNIPFDQLEKRVKEVTTAKSIIVYGESDLVSFRAGVRLSDLNVFTARTLSGNNHLKPESGFLLEP